MLTRLADPDGNLVDLVSTERSWSATPSGRATTAPGGVAAEPAQGDGRRASENRRDLPGVSDRTSTARALQGLRGADRDKEVCA